MSDSQTVTWIAEGRVVEPEASIRAARVVPAEPMTISLVSTPTAPTEGDDEEAT